MNHFLNFRVRVVYYLLVTLVYGGLLYLFDLHINKSEFLILSILFLLYYLFDISNFNSYKVNKKKLIMSIIINGIGFSMLYWIRREEEIVLLFPIYTITQLTLKYLLSFIRKENIRVLILGYDDPTEKIIKILEEKKNKYEYVGYVHETKEKEDKYLGIVENIEEIVKRNNINEIIFTSRKQAKKYAESIMNLKLNGYRVNDYLSFLEVEEGKVDVEKIDALWILMSDGFVSFNTDLQKHIKRIFDLCLAFIIGVLTLPIMLIAAIIVKIESPGPIIYSQARVGENQKEFFVHKFRSMRNDAEKNGAKWAVENDPRVTKFGKFMRKTRIDELPQIWNVLKGEMSFIGPRPERQVFIKEIEKVVPYYNVRHFIKPGLTGWAQVMYPYGASIEDAKCKLEYDLYYLKHQDFILDIIIMFKTLHIIVFGKGR
ncbi:TIGR03013 family XrtA/PEP-CTERM system glycosyltransferase [Fusobacterium sp.]|uniref:TIGR03013 family XrtA/PEP-CTERM system glycosyltransferase n=1 Tax=Fusobacterium sp. TaxID=68766 RepID=UPI002619C91B|nr:TIGR03013 family XrtA/PEP-CTERM system glycosyltransferase [Fusobacterium sp.]